MTPAQLESLVRRYGEEKEWQDFRTALICSVITHGPLKKPKQPEHFMPEKQKKHPKKQTPEDLLTSLRLMNASMGGREEEKN